MTTTPENTTPDTQPASGPADPLGFAQPRSAELPAAEPAKSAGVGIPSAATRRYLYAVVIALILAAQAFRLLPGEYVDTVVNVVTAVLGVGAPALAIPNTGNPLPASGPAVGE